MVPRPRGTSALVALAALLVACASTVAPRIDPLANVVAAGAPRDELRADNVLAALAAADKASQEALVTSFTEQAAPQAPAAFLAAVLHDPRRPECADPLQSGRCAAARGLELEPSEASALVAPFGATVTWSDERREELRGTGSFGQLQTTLGSDERVVRFVQTGPDGWLALVVSGLAVTAVPLGVSAEAVASQARALRVALASPPGRRREDFWPPAVALYEHLWRPLEAHLPAGAHVTIIPERALFGVPFAALVRLGDEGKPQFLIERHALSSALSLSFLVKAARRELLPFSVAILGNPRPPVGGTLGRAFPALPAAELEARSIGNLFPGATLALGANANEAELKRALTQRSIVHVASHAKSFQSAPLKSFIALSPGDGEDGFVTAAEIANLSIRSQLVVLSACETGVTDATGYLGLHSSLMVAGAAAVLSTLWQVDDDATAELMQAFYSGYGRRTKARGLAEAQRSLLARARTSDPYYWGAFVLYDDMR